MSATIFVIDDDPAGRSVVVRRLRGRKFRVCGYASGEEAINGLGREEPDVVLLDLKMPSMSGLETLRTIRQRRPRVLVIIMTAYGAVQAAVEAMRLGAHDFIEKTIDLNPVEQAIDRAVEQIRLRRQLKTQHECDDERFA